MLFQRLQHSSALNLFSYVDVDQFRESERYLRAESVPLVGRGFSIRRAELALPDSKLSLVRTFPRIVNGYELGGRAVVVIPMNGVTSARINGEQIGSAVLVLRGNAQCTVYEPEGRLVAILSTRQENLYGPWPESDRGYRLIALPEHELGWLQARVAGMLEFAAQEPEAGWLPIVRISLQEALLGMIERTLCLGELVGVKRHGTLLRYKAIVDRIDSLVRNNPMADLSCEQLANEVGASVRTVQTATQALCGSGSHHYGRLRRLWMVRQQLRSGAAGLTVKASAQAHGFHHMGEFSGLYCAAFGELPSETLVAAR